MNGFLNFLIIPKFTIMNRLILTSLVISLCTQTFGQLYNFTNYSIDQGLPQSTVYCIYEDSFGYLWLGTESGVARFDGTRFKTYDQSSGLPGNTVRSIIKGPDNNIWVGTEKGIGIFDGSKWKSITSTDGLEGSAILNMNVDGHRRVWVATNDAGINILTLGDSIKIEKLDAQNGLSSDFVFDVLHDTLANKSWIAMFGGVNMVVETEKGFVVRNLEDSVITPSNQITCIEKDKKGDFWFGTHDAGAFKLTIRKGKYVIEGYGALKGITDPIIWDIKCDNDNQVWLASNDHGLYNLNKGQIKNISMDNGLPGNLILSLYRDSNRNMWLGSMGNGLTLYRGNALVHYTREQGLPGQKVLAVKNTPDGKLWVGTDEKGLALLQFTNESMKAQYFDKKQGFISKQVISLDLDADGDLLLGTRGNGMARYINGRFYYLTASDGLADNNINFVYQVPNYSVFAGTNMGFNEIRNNQIGIISSNDGLINDEVQTVITDRKGNIWIGTMGGLAYFQSKTNTYRDFNQEEGLFDLSIYCLAADKYDNIWIGTANGIYKYVLAADTIISLSALNLGTKIINSLVFYNDSTLIAGTNAGFNKIIFDKKIEQPIRVDSYDKQNGFRFGETNQNALCKDNKGHVWFGTIGGLTCYRPELEDTITQIPKVYITGVRLSYQNVDWPSLGFKTSGMMNLPQPLSLAYNKNHVTFDFNGIYLRNPEKVQYRYKLEPNETDWSPVTKSNSSPYSSLSNGDFTISVMATIDGQHWSDAQVYHFTIRPPFWKTVWFYLGLAILFTFMLVGYIRRREHKLKKEKEHLEQVVKERTAEVVAQKDKIEKQNEEITDSITYAQRIQRAVLPGIDTLENHTADCFVLFKPRDIVSGDFYWIGKVDNLLIVGAADCTGHGVPGAFMSMLGVSFMNKIIKEQKVALPDLVLAEMRRNVITSLKQGNHEGSSKDGMDMALCIINLDTLAMTYSGAYNPAIIVSNGEANELKADRMPVGYHIVMNEYTPISIQLKKGDCVYLFSDGYQDQMGGPTCRKFMRKNLRELLVDIHQKKFYEQRDLLNTTIEDWRNHPMGKTDQMDDILVMGFKV